MELVLGIASTFKGWNLDIDHGITTRVDSCSIWDALYI